MSNFSNTCGGQCHTYAGGLRDYFRDVQILCVCMLVPVLFFGEPSDILYLMLNYASETSGLDIRGLRNLSGLLHLVKTL